MISFTYNVRGGKALPLTPEELKRCRLLESVVGTSARLRDITIEMKALDPNCDLYKQLEEEKKQIKINRPALIPHASSFDDMERKNQKAHPSGFVFFDVDHIGDPSLCILHGSKSPRIGEEKRPSMQEVIDRVMAKKEELQIALFEISPSGDGLHLIFKKPEGMTIQEAQQWMEDQIGVAGDEGTFDLARCSFMVPESYVLYQNDDLLFSPNEISEAELKYYSMSPLQGSGKGGGRRNDSADALSCGISPLQGSIAEASSFCTKAWDLCLAEAGLSSDELDIPGERNWHNSLKSILSVGICQLMDQPQLLAVVKQKMPNYYETQDCKRLISDFYKNYVDDNARMSLTLRNIYSKAIKSERPQQSELSTPLPMGEGLGGEAFGELPRLPRLLQLLIKSYPEDYRPAVIMSSLVFLGALMTKVRSYYLDGSVHSTSFLGCVVAPQASGKSFTRRLYDILTAPIKAADVAAREIERKFNEKRKSAKNKRDQPEDPMVKIRLIPATASNAMILKRADYARGEHLCTYAEEIDTLTKGKKAGAWSEKSDLYRMAFDNAEWGQDYMSDNSYSGQVKLFYNLLVCGTPNAVSRFFNDVEDGLVSRVMFMQLPDMMGCRMPKFGNYSHRDIREINRIVQQIYDDNEVSEVSEGSEVSGGEAFLWVKSKALEDCIYNWLEDKRLEYLQTQDNPALEIFRRRAGVIGYRAGLVAYVLNDMKYAPMVGEFALWVANFVLHNQLALFGERMNQIMNKVEENDYQVKVIESTRKGCNAAIFDLLGKQFTDNELFQRRMAEGRSGPIYHITNRWERNGMIRRVSKGVWEKI